MATITTATFTTGDENTSHQSGESVRDWVVRHGDAIKLLVPDSDPLVTTWPIKDPPGTKSTSTTRLTGESDASFIDRHITAYELDMATDNPDPS